MSTYCPACKVDLVDTDRRTHLRSEWHIYNLKRVVAKLPPLSEAEFTKKRTIFAATAESAGISKASKKRYCQFCKKSFDSIRTFENHRESWQHKTNEEHFNTKGDLDERLKEIRSQLPSLKDVDDEIDVDGLGRPIPVGDCLFCDRSFSSNPYDAIDRVLRHMSDRHRFSLPNADKLADPAGLLTQLGILVGVEFACLACGKQFLGRRHGEMPVNASDRRREALAALRGHMRDAQHCFLYTGVDDPVHIALAVAEAQEEVLDGKLDPEYLPPIARIGGELYSQFYFPEKADNTTVLPEDADGSAYEVRLPNGNVLGHRKHYQTVYKQNLAYSLHQAAADARKRHIPAALPAPRQSRIDAHHR